jgi:hypothetical protein
MNISSTRHTTSPFVTRVFNLYKQWKRVTQALLQFVIISSFTHMSRHHIGKSHSLIMQRVNTDELVAVALFRYLKLHQFTQQSVMEGLVVSFYTAAV